jgi:hypothetical protein
MSNPQHAFSIAPQVNVSRSVFDRSHTVKTTFNEALLVPVFVDEVLPGDTFSLDMTALCRMATPIFPIMDNIYMDSFFFFVPNRLVWHTSDTDGWEAFCGQSYSGSSTNLVTPKCTSPTAGYTVSSLQDYFGLPCVGSTVGGGGTVTHNNLPIRGYAKIVNDWFLDQNLQSEVHLDTGDGPDTYSNYTLFTRGKRHDYFTSCLPWPQKNNTGTAVSVGLAGTAAVKGNGTALTMWDGTSEKVMGYATGTTSFYPGTNAPPLAVGAIVGAVSGYTNQHAIGISTNAANSGLIADLSTATGITIDALRLAFQTQKLYERDARGGTRYIEILKSHFGVTSPDFRLQRAEYLGGGSTRLNINAVTQTGATGASGTTTPIGTLSAYAVLAARNNGFTHSFVEHGYVIGLVNVRSDMTYGQGMNRMWSRSTRLDYYWPVFQAIGEQAVLNKEIYMIGDGGTQDNAVFGYQEAWAEYRYKPSVLTGLMRTDVATNLDTWHLGYQFGSLPVLNSSFIQEAPPISRVVAVPSQPRFIGDFYFNYKCVRPMPVYSVPGLIDHF